MKNLLLTTALAAGLALPALAQDAPSSPFQTEAAGPSVSASDIIGSRIYVSEAAVDADAYNGVQKDWQDIGEVNDIILGRDGTVDAVLVDIGGFLGIGERQVAVDMSALKIVQDDATDADDWFLVLQTDRATLEGAPEYVRPGMKPAADANGAATNDTAATGTDTTGQGTATDQAAEQSATTEGTAGTGNATDTTAPADTATNDGTATTGTATDGTAPVATAPTMGSDGTVTLPEGYTNVARETLTAETLTGADVRDMNDQSIAEVSDLALTADGQVTDVILDVGGFLGIGARSVAIPMDRLTVAQTEGGAVRIWVNMTKDELKALPEYAK